MGSVGQPGLIPRICNEMFERIGDAVGATFKVSVSYYEIYNEAASDLLFAQDPRSKPKTLKIRESPEIGIIARNSS